MAIYIQMQVHILFGFLIAVFFFRVSCIKRLASNLQCTEMTLTSDSLASTSRYITYKQSHPVYGVLGPDLMTS